MSDIRKCFVALLMAALLPGIATGQERGTVGGTVVDAATQQPLGGAQVLVAGTQIGTVTNQEGRFIISNVPAGAREIRTSLIGYGQATRAVNVAAGGTANLDIALSQTAVALDEITVSATGQIERRRETGNVVSSISVDDVEQATVSDIADVLTGRAAGVIVQNASGTTGTSQRIRIRGSNSVSLSNQPLLIVDGVRVNNSALGLLTAEAATSGRAVWVGGQETSRWNDLSPEEIESIEILKGPAASALYGTAAANGVVQITTRRGRAGETRWNVFSEAGQLNEQTEFPANYQRIGISTATGNRVSCTLANQSLGACVPKADSTYSYSPLESDSPFRAGWRINHGINVTGGTEAATYFLAGELEREQGVLDPNFLDKVNLRANVRSQLRENLSATVTTGYVGSLITLPWNDNDGQGALGTGLLGSARDNTPTKGWFFDNPRAFFFQEMGQEIDRFTGGIDLNYLPASWLSIVGQAGMDQSHSEDFQFIPAGVYLDDPSLAEGSRRVNRLTYGTVTANLSGSATRQLTADLQSTTSVGSMYTSETKRGTYAFGRQLPTGTGALGAASAGFSIDESRQEIVTVGAYARQQVAWRDRLFLSVAVRGDDNSTFGEEFAFVTYPSASASWVLSDEPFFPETSTLSSLRLRAAYGQSGQRPGFRQASTFYTPVAVRLKAVDVSAVTIGGTGNVALKPERSSEIELGFDAGLFDNRVALEFTYYDRTTRDALIARRLPPSLGESLTRFENVAEVTNSGLEAMLSANLFSQNNFGWDVTVTASGNTNTLVELGEDVEPILFGDSDLQRHAEGYPLGSFFTNSYEFSDANNDKIITQSEITPSEDEEFLGNPFPKFELAVSNEVTLFSWLQVSGLLDYKAGQRMLNYTKYFRCAGFGNCQDVFDPSTSLEDQAAAQAARPGMELLSGYIEDATFLKLRELAFTLRAPQSITPRFVSDLSLTIAGRNLKTWSDYSGFDPEANSGQYGLQGNFGASDFFTLPAVRYWTARANVSF